MAVDSCKVIQTTNMAARYHSPEAVSLRSTFKVLRTDYIKKYFYSHHDPLLDELLYRDSVRGNRDPRTRTPEVNSKTPAGILLKRMRRQIKAVCILAEMVHDGPPANESEAALLSRAIEMLTELGNTVKLIPGFPDCQADSN
ncbi:unnamed protein product [Auanema sp. JU1783]|nr:unnamed protein product [Auanema sp. JU1783]